MAPPLYASSAIMSAAALLLAVLAAARDHDACETAQQAFSECVPYVVGQAPAASPNCCTGLGDLRDMGSSGGAAACEAGPRTPTPPPLRSAGADPIRFDPNRAGKLPARPLQPRRSTDPPPDRPIDLSIHSCPVLPP